MKILIVEDEIITATDLKETLQKKGHEITAIAKNYTEAVNAMNQQLPDLIIIDIRLRNSEQDGISFAEEITKEYKIPFVYLTSSTELETFNRAKLTLPAAYLLKPFRHQELAFQVELAYNHYQVNNQSENNPAKAESIFLPVGSYDVPRFCGASVNMTMFDGSAEYPRSWTRYCLMFMASLMQPFNSWLVP